MKLLKYKKYVGSIVLSFIALGLMAQDNLSALMPMPNSVVQQNGTFSVDKKTSILINSESLEFAALQLQNILKERMSVDANVASSENAQIQLIIDSEMVGNEHYILNVEPNRLTITGPTIGAVLYGVMTLDQIMLGDIVNSKLQKIACVKIDDSPRFGSRALMLDPARHFIPLDDVKFFIDQMARFKYNVLQLHLTDDQGWRVEIKKYPHLTEIGARGDTSVSINTPPNNGYYTQNQLKDLIVYAAERNIEIVPELDIPGHTVALLAAYPELGCTHTDTIQKVIGKTVNMMLCAGNQDVYTMYKDVVSEIAAIFPSKKIHLGGDESVMEKNWAQCDRCKALMHEKGYTKPAQLMNVFFGKILEYVRASGKEPILWCELDNIYPPANDYLFDYPKDVVLVAWRGGLTPKCLELTAIHGNKIIMAPGEYCYLDYPQLKGDFPEFNNWGMPVTTLEQCYKFDPGYDLPLEKQSHVLGVMGTLWGEAMLDINRVTYMTYPRAMALAEAGWTQMSQRSWQSFVSRMYPNISNLMRHGVSVRVPFEVVDREK